VNWDAIGAIAELVGALGVIVSLAYLAIQIRQSTDQSRLNTSAIEATAFQHLLDHHSVMQFKVVEDPALLDVLNSKNEAPLDTADGRKFLVWATALFRSHYNAWCLMEKGLISKDQWDVLGAAIDRVGPSSRAMQEAWALRHGEFPLAFATAFSERFET